MSEREALTTDELEKRQHHIFSGSVLGRRFLCPGSAHAEENAPPTEPSDIAIRCSRYHREVAYVGTADDLTPEEQELVQKVRDWREGIFSGRWLYEVFLPLFDAKGQLLSWGWADGIAILPDKVLLGEWKFGWSVLDQVYAAWQLAFYMVAIAQNYQMPVEGHLICARTGETYTAKLDDPAGDLERIIAVVEACKRPNALLNPSPSACRYCRGLAACPAAAKEIELITADKKQLTPERRAHRRAFLAVVEDWIEHVKKEDRQYVLNGGHLPGWHLEEHKGNRYIDDPLAAYQALDGLMTREEFIQALEIKITALEELVTNVLINKGAFCLAKEAKEHFERLLEGVIKRGANKTYIVRDRSENG